MDAALTATAVRFAINKLAALLEAQYKAVSGVKGELKKLRSMLSMIDDILKDADSRPVTDRAVKNLLEKLKDIACDIEDVLDMFESEAMRRRSGGQRCMMVRDFFSPNNHALFRFKMSCKIKSVITKLDSIFVEKALLLNLSQGTAERQRRLECHREAYSQNSFVVVGREMEKQNIIDLLINHKRNAILSVIAIVGMGGLGKTTLAQLVFNDERVKDHFGLTMWKVVGSDFHPAKLMESVLQLATGEKVDISETDLVRQELQRALSGKRFLLVLDDVWNEDESSWGDLKAVLKYGATGSKVIVTTRSLKVSLIMGSSSPQELQPLSDDHCLSLFRQFALQAGEECHNLIEIDGEILKKCGGVPLAVKALGSLVRFRPIDTWLSVLSSTRWEGANGEDKILAVLRMSYNNLTPQSKQCFAFCSLFPKNHGIEKEKLIQLWTANGFICSQDLETIGNHVFSELLMKSFFQERETHDDDEELNVTKYKMHDLMHDLSRSIAGDECRILGYDSVEAIQKRTRHLFIDQGFSLSISQALCKSQSLRTMLSPRNGSVDANVLDCVFSKLKFLRVLDLSGSDIEKLPESLGKLLHLRYLNLSYTPVKGLPDSIVLLQNVEYLILRHVNHLELPKELRCMQSLRHLDISGCKNLTHMPPGFLQLTRLQRLSDFVVGKETGCSIRELKDLDLHGELNIKFYENEYEKDDSFGGQKILRNQQHLESLIIKWKYDSYAHSSDDSEDDDNEEKLLYDLCPHASLKRLRISNYGGRKFPTWLAESQILNLVEVKLTKCNNCVHIPQFGNLKYLTKLEVIEMESVKSINTEFYGNGPVKGFPSLKQLWLEDMPNLEEWSGSEGLELFPCLHTLTIKYCPQLKGMPRFPRIQHLRILGCDGSLLSFVVSLTSLSSLVVAKYLSPTMTSLPSGLLQNLSSLTDLVISGLQSSLPLDEMHHLTALENLEIEDCKDLTSLSLDMDHLSALQSLYLRDCINLVSLPKGLQNLTSLISLKVLNCQNVTFQPEVIMQKLNSVREFQIEICSKKVNLSGRLQHLQTLQKLSISGRHTSFGLAGDATLGICCCDELDSLMEGSPYEGTVLEHLIINNCSSLTALPDWVAELRSLRYLTLYDCPALASLPRGLQNLPSLVHLWTRGCPQLERCKRELFLHMPNIFDT